MSLGELSKLTIIVEPVVVIPDILSKKASTNDKLRLDNKNGQTAKMAIPSQDKVVRRKACCRFQFLFFS
jgi:thymidine phosphorylase